jgi:hypothetical protein
MVGVTRINVYTAHSPCCADEAESRERAVQQRFKLSNFPTFQLSNFPTFQLSNFPTFQRQAISGQVVTTPVNRAVLTSAP